jgi:hypothetical protein
MKVQQPRDRGLRRIGVVTAALAATGVVGAGVAAIAAHADTVTTTHSTGTSTTTKSTGTTTTTQNTSQGTVSSGTGSVPQAQSGGS